jgi:hypothetical protein
VCIANFRWRHVCGWCVTCALTSLGMRHIWVARGLGEKLPKREISFKINIYIIDYETCVARARLLVVKKIIIHLIWSRILCYDMCIDHVLYTLLNIVGHMMARWWWCESFFFNTRQRRQKTSVPSWRGNM